jgi:hypothetical protein
MSVALLNIVIGFLSPIEPGIVVEERVRSVTGIGGMMRVNELFPVGDALCRILKT